MNPPCPLRRSGDGRHPRLCALREWWGRWGQFVTGLWLVGLSAVMTIALVVYAIDQHQAAQAARASCERTKQLGPYAVKDAERRRVYPPEQLKIAKATIPTSCP
jgi:hypothetical protein